MENHTPRFKVRLGIFIAVGILIFVTAIFIIGKQQNLFNPVFKISTNFFNVSGLQVGNNIRFSGINVGIVDNIKIINDSTVQVDMLVRKDVQQFIKADSYASIGSEGIIGDRIIIITQGSPNSPVANDGQHILSKEPIETDDIMKSLKSSAESAEIITVQLAEIMSNINNGQGMLGRLIQDTVIAENVNMTIENFRKSSEGLDQTIEVTKENVFAFMESLQKTAAKTEVASDQLGEIMLKINNGEGTIGMLVQDTSLVKNIDETVINLKESSIRLNENMEALKHNFLFRGYFKRKAKEEEKMRMETDSVMPVKSD
ncbi:MlaD family protein [Marinilabilia salmonicolor]|jgi:phospholipid/cholesterol/gamma-HCH transport system substrate-binding protein|uniref:Phospholipid/cholesterol/gamma-HCH transport system substrate-binding protein n=1 Tax=Marinilabilia salmonicolor TaxID=989 RepID=A0A2T0XH45_9BACT|nr:MlaD family protein [Marinilabilia salmonicolor]PRY98266.1 phospholipid/cholesterol/gamma-HCH transport system substrate-binding protein [Marinilabilia salmonicolor]RCW33840.1 phospholipid/cholesterol/gamma-HCH transport system substrate-binding protein [Marinilabilia salmonicolor]